jgi:uncharacterized membrane protein
MTFPDTIFAALQYFLHLGEAMIPLLSEMLEPAAETIANGFTLAYIVMGGMVAAVVYTIVAMIWGIQHPPRPRPQWIEYLTPALCLIGMGVAGYLTYVEFTSDTVLCGPVGDCNAVNSSPYAKLFGVLPVGLMGLGGYIAILAAWLWRRFGSGKPADAMPALLFGMALFGVLFSIYLTYLELYVIFAVCLWCLSSAVIITALLLLNIHPVLLGMGEVEEEPSRAPKGPGPGSKAVKHKANKRKKRR